MSSLRKTLQARYGDKPVALGGVFLVEKGKANLHIMVGIAFIMHVLSDRMTADIKKLKLKLEFLLLP